ncbi:M48 family metallopeptidase [Candidatus Woesearchaeota archaeon]|nr:M48 family metallopeptidase [Candidatus Woesearchaeota archaeon]
MYEQIARNKRNSYILFSLVIALIIFLGYVFGYVYGAPYAGIAIAVVVGLIYVLIGYYAGDKMILSISGAKEATKPENAYLINTVEGLSIAAGIPKPKIYVIQDEAINALATGRNPENAAVAVTTGALKKLNRIELEGVVAHELSHVKNYDVRFMTLVVILVGLIALISNVFIRSFMFGGNNRDRGNAGIIIVLVGVILAILSPILAYLIKLAISRKREYLADADGALLTRYPKGLADALKKIKKENLPTKKATSATANLYFSNPFKSHSFNALFSTHPPIDNRIKALEGM